MPPPDANAALRNAKLRFLMNGYYGMFACLPSGPFGEVGGGVASEAAVYFSGDNRRG